MKKKLLSIYKTILILLLLIIIGYMFLYLAYKLEFKNIEKNLIISLDSNLSLKYKRNYESYLSNIDFIESVMISEALIKESTPLINSAQNLNLATNDGNTAILDLIHGDNKLYIGSYARYWHGYLLPLKILLNIFTLTEIRLMLFLVLIFLFIAISILFYKNKIEQYIFSFFTCMSLLYPIITFKSFNYVNIYLMLIYIVFLLLYQKKLKEDNLKYAYLIFGALTSYFDLLTIPLITLCFPLMISLLLVKNKSIKETIKLIILLSIYWSIGYLGMWVGKWAISSIILKKNVFKDAIDTILFRTINANKGKISYIDIFKNFSNDYQSYLFIVIFVNFIFLLIKYIKVLAINKEKIKINYTGICFFLIALYPFIWYFVVRQHSYQHPFFSFKLISITVLAVIIGINNFVQEQKK